MPKQSPGNISQAVNTPLSEILHGMFNYGIAGNIISGGMLANDAPNVYAENVAQLATIGSRLRMVDGREFIYCRDGGAGIGVALMGQAEGPVSEDCNHSIPPSWQRRL